jgi:hypothetical protein
VRERELQCALSPSPSAKRRTLVRVRPFRGEDSDDVAAVTIGDRGHDRDALLPVADDAVGFQSGKEATHR